MLSFILLPDSNQTVQACFFLLLASKDGKKKPNSLSLHEEKAWIFNIFATKL